MIIFFLLLHSPAGLTPEWQKLLPLFIVLGSLFAQIVLFTYSVLFAAYSRKPHREILPPICGPDGQRICHFRVSNDPSIRHRSEFHLRR
jgi:hypothetical protein